MPWQLIIVAFIGVSVGSFINVVGNRYGTPGALLTGRSACPRCGKGLAWWELVPLISFVALRGRCAGCHQKISWQYPIVEAVTASTWIWAFSPWPATAGAAAYAATSAAIISTLLVLFLIDRRLMLLPDMYLLYLGIFVVVRLAIMPPVFPPAHLAGSILGAGFLLVLWFITGGRGIGFGDIKLMIPLGLLFAFTATVTLLWLAFVAGGIVAAYLLFTRRATLKSAVPFGPFLIAAAVLLLIAPGIPALLFAPLTL